MIPRYASHPMTDPNTPSPRVSDYESRDYREFWEGQDKAFLHEQEVALLKEIIPTAPGWFIDVGCAHGRLVPLYDRPDRQLVLLDYSLNHLELAAKSHPGTNHHFIAADGYRLPFKESVFDALITIRVFHHMEAPEVFMREMARVLRPGQRAVVEYSNTLNPFRILRRGPKALKKEHVAYPGEMLFGIHPALFREISDRVGFDLHRIRGTGLYDQLVRISKWFRAPGQLLEPSVAKVLGRLSLAPATFVEMERRGMPAPGMPHGAPLFDLLACPACHARLEDGATIRCTGCDAIYERRGPVLDLRVKTPTT